MAAAFVALLCGAVGDDSAAFAVTTLAGQVAVSEASDGVGAGAMFRDPAGIAIQSELGRALIADYANFAVRSLQLATGNVTTLAGRLGSAGSEDGAAGVARFMGPAALAVHPSGSYALVVDQPTHAIRRLDLATLAVTTVAGQAGAAGADDGSGLAAKFRLPGGIAIPQNVLQAGFALVADTGNGVVRRLQLGDDAKVVDGALVSWRVTTFAGTAGSAAGAAEADGVGTAAAFREPRGIAVADGGGFAFVTGGGVTGGGDGAAASMSNRVRRLDLKTGAVTTVAGPPVGEDGSGGGGPTGATGFGSGGSTAGAVDGVGDAARFDDPVAVALNSWMYALVADAGNREVRMVNQATRMVTTVAGLHSALAAAAADGVGAAARFGDRLGAVAIDPIGGFALLVDGHAIRRLVLPCNLGRRWSPTGTLNCSVCAAGSFTSGGTGVTRTACTICPAGSACNGGSALTTCTAGRFAPAGSAACSAACGQDDRYAPRGAAECAACPSGSFTAGGDASTRESCAACPEGHKCDGSSVRVPCAKGRFAAGAGNAACALCPLHQYQPSAGGAACQLCSELEGGALSVTAAKGSTSAADCTAAGADRARCPPGASAVHNNASSAACLPCEAGRFQPAANSTDACERCDCGTFSRVGAAACDAVCLAGTYGDSDSGTCEPCPAEHFCLSSQKRPFHTARQCIPGQRELRPPSASSDRACEPCGAMHFSRAVNAASCEVCPGGKFQTEPGQPFCEAKQPCPPGTYETDEADAAGVATYSSARCRPCPAGTFSRASDAPACEACAAGTYQPAAGQSFCAAHTVCTAGAHASAAPSASSDRACEPCAVGRFSARENAAACGPCPGGSFQPDVGKSFCLPRSTCAAGERVLSAPNATADRSCQPCAAGAFSASKNAGSCEVCPGGAFQPEAGQASCTKHAVCTAGERVAQQPNATADRVCEPCGAMHFSRAANAASCEVCPGGKFQAEPGQPFCEAKQPCPPGTYETDEADAAGVATYSSARCRPCPPMHYSAQSNLRSCSRCPAGKFQASAGEPFCETCGEGVTCNVQAGSGLVELRACPVGNECRSSGNGTAVEPCENKVSDAATGKCVSCDDREFAHTASNECVACPRLRPEDDKSAELARGVQCVGGGISVQDDFFVVGSRLRAVALGRGTTVVRCRGSGVCRTPAPTRAGNFTVRTACVPPAAGALCGACAPTHAKTAQTCVACSGNSLFSGCILAAAVTLFGVLYRQCIKFAMNNACRGHTSRFMTSSMLKIAMTFLFNTSLLSRFQLDWSALLRTGFEVSAVAGSGDPTIFGVQCFGLGLHEKTVLVAAAPFVVPLLPLPMLARAWLKGGGPGGGIGTVFKVPARDAYWAAVLIGWWLVHPAVLAHCIVALMTLSVGGREYALADLSIEATDPAYRQTRLLATVVLCTFVPAVPAYVFGRLWKFRRSLRAGELSSGAQDAIPESQRKRLFYFFGSYAPERYYWESVVFATRTVMVGLAAISSTLVDEGQVQVVIFVTTWVALVHFMLVFKFEPYSRKMESQVNKLTWFTLLSLLLSALGLSTGAAAATDGVFKTVLLRLCATLLLATVAVLVWVFAGQCHGKREQIREQKRTKRQQLCEEEPSGKDTSIEWLDVEHTPAAEPARGRDEWNIFPSKGSQLTVMHNPLSSSLGGGGSMSPATSRMHISARLDH